MRVGQRCALVAAQLCKRRRSILLLVVAASATACWVVAHSQTRVEVLSNATTTLGTPHLFIVSESLPTAWEGGGMRLREATALAMETLGLRGMLVARSPNTEDWLKRVGWVEDDFYRRQDLDVVADTNVLRYKNSAVNPAMWTRDPDSELHPTVPVPILETTYRGTTGTAMGFFDFASFVGGHGFYAKRGSVTVSVALLTMWSWRVAPSGEPHPTIPETYTPLLRAHSPGSCILVMTDDIQHRRFSIELNISASVAERLAERELVAYEAADGVFFVSDEDRDEIGAMLRRRRSTAQPSALSASPAPKLLTLPYFGSAAAAAPPSRPKYRVDREQPVLLFVGSNTRSNRLAIHWLATKVLPVMRAERASLELSVVGRINVSESLGVGGADEEGALKAYGVKHLGFVKDVASLLSRTALLLVPGMVGSGTTTKVQLGIEHQVPVVTTSPGARGVWREGGALPAACTGPHRPLVVRDDPRQYAGAVLQLLTDDDAYEGAVRCLQDFHEVTWQHRPTAQRAALSEMRRHCQALTEQRGAQAVPPVDPPANGQLPATTADSSAVKRVTSPEPVGLAALLPEADNERPRTDHAFMRRLAKFLSWRSSSTSPASAYRRGRDLTVLTAFVAKDVDYVSSWLRDIARQRALAIFSVELVIGCFEPEAFEIIATGVASMLAALGELARVSIALFEGDPGSARAPLMPPPLIPLLLIIYSLHCYLPPPSLVSPTQRSRDRIPSPRSLRYMGRHCGASFVRADRDQLERGPSQAARQPACSAERDECRGTPEPRLPQPAGQST